MASRHDPWHQALAQSQSIDATQEPNTFEASQLKPTRGHRMAIAELSLRFPCPRDTDPEEYASRLDYLAKDTCHLAVGLLRAACDRAAQSARGMPYASEIIACAAAVVENRQRADEAKLRQQGSAPQQSTDPRADALSQRARQANRDNEAIGSPMRWTDAMEAFRIGSPGEKRATRQDGSVIEPWLGEDGDWHPTKGDGHALASAYRLHNAEFVVVSGNIKFSR